jgi:hypothetical protein
LIIPSKFLRQTQLCITDKESKYDVFKDRWEYVEVYNKFYKWLKWWSNLDLVLLDSRKSVQNLIVNLL